MSAYEIVVDCAIIYKMIDEYEVVWAETVHTARYHGDEDSPYDRLVFVWEGKFYEIQKPCGDYLFPRNVIATEVRPVARTIVQWEPVESEPG